jgi:hypothetical protein
MLYFQARYLLYTYFNRKWSLHVNPQGLEILMLIGEERKMKKIAHHCHYNLLVKNTPIHNILYLLFSKNLNQINNKHMIGLLKSHITN